MQGTRLLAVTPPPEAFESMPSYLLRLSAANGLRSPVAIYARLRPGPRRAFVGFGFSVEDLSDLTGWSTSVLADIAQSCAFQNGERTVRKLTDRLVSERFRRLNAPAFCAICAQEHGYIERVWDLSAVQACPVHACWAVTHCASCGSPVAWERSCLTHCRCGAPYADSVPEKMPPPLALASSELIMRAVTNRQGPGYPELLGFPPELRGLPLRNILRLQTDLVRLMRTAAPVDTESLGVAVSGKIMEQWPVRFMTILESYRASVGAEAVVKLLFDRKTGLFSRYQIDNAEPGQCLSFLADAVFEFIDGDAPVFVDPRYQARLYGKRRGRWRSLSYVARQLGIGTQKLNQLADQGRIVPVVGEPRRRLVDPACITDDQVRALFRVHPRDAAKEIGLPLATFKAALESRMFGPPDRRRGIAIGQIERIKRAVADAAVRTLVRKDRRSQSPCRTVGEILNSPRYSTAAKAAMVQLLLQGRLVAVARTGDSFRDLMLDVDELAVVLGGLSKAIPVRYLDATQVAQLLWCSTNAVRDLVELGQLREGEHGHRRKIAIQSCRRFQRHFVSARELGDLFGWSQVRLIRVMGALRRPPVLLQLNRRAGWFVRRSSLPSVGHLAKQLLQYG